MSGGESLDATLAEAVARLCDERPELDQRTIEDTISRLRTVLLASDLGKAQLHVLPARSSVVLEVRGATSVSIIKAPIFRRHAELEAGALSAWGQIGLTPRLLAFVKPQDALVMTVAPGLPLYRVEPQFSISCAVAVAKWYARCHAAQSPRPPAWLSSAEILDEWASWLGGHHPLTRKHAGRAFEVIRRVSQGLEVVMTHGDPSRANFLYDAISDSLTAVDPLPCLLPVQVILSRAALQVQPEAPQAFLRRARAFCGLDMRTTRDLLPALAVLTLDWNHSKTVLDLADAFAAEATRRT